MSNKIKKFDGGGEVGGFAWGLAQEMASPELGMISDAQYTDRIISMIEDGYYYGQTPEQLEAQLLGLSVEQMNAKTEDMLDSILKSQGENETGFVNESARIAAENILKGKIAQAGVTDPAAQEAALKSAMESLEGGASGLEAVKAAAGGAKDYVEELLKTAKDVIDGVYDATIGKLPEILTPESVTIDPTTGQVTGTFEIGDEGSPPMGGSAPIFGGQVGTVGGGTQVGVTTTGNAVLDAIIKAAKDGVDQQDIEDVVGAIISTTTGISKDIVDAGIGGAKEAIDAAKTVVGANVTDDEDDDDATNVTIGGGAVTTRTCNDGSVVGITEACPEDITTITGGDGTGTSTIDPSSTNVKQGVGVGDDTIDTIIANSVCGKGQINVNGTCVNSRDTDICPNGDIIMKGEKCPTVVAETQTCWDGSVILATEKCPPKPPETQTCWDGSVIAATEKCPPKPPETQTCWDGSVIAATEKCPPREPETQTCWDGSVILATEKCPPKGPETQTCWDGSVILATEKCPPKGPILEEKCPPGSILADQPIPADKNCNPSGPPVILEEKCPKGTILADQPIPADKNCNPSGPPVILEEKCPKGTILADQPIPADKNCNPSGPPVILEEKCPEGSKLAGQPIPADKNCNPGGGTVIVTGDDTTTGSGVPLTTTNRINPAVRAIAGDVVDIDYLYDIGGPSIFAPTMQMDEDKNRPYIYSGFADGGIVKEYDLEQLLKKIRG